MKHKPLVIGVLVFLLLTAAGTAFAVLRPQERTVTAVMAVSPRIEQGSSTSGDVIQLMAQKYAAYCTSPEVLKRASEASGITVKDLLKSTKVAVEPMTANVDIEVHHTDPARAAAAANSIANWTVDRIEYDQMARGDVVRSADVVAAEPAMPRPLLIAASALAGLALGGATAYVLWSRRGRDADRATRGAAPSSKRRGEDYAPASSRTREQMSAS